ncbi:hypothetical protein B296_00020584 [Ensete ventricosum]|uniref:Uncharacterized protein n=1 Tax=Ensete ventricosum TaxID=4639 RepID=A0A426ZT91_ENSVE|nr:hypothetical protein B296_00020584 [Ensete ventricosum]
MMVLVAMEIYKRKEEMGVRMVETYKCKEGKRRVVLVVVETFEVLKIVVEVTCNYMEEKKREKVTMVVICKCKGEEVMKMMVAVEMTKKGEEIAKDEREGGGGDLKTWGGAEEEDGDGGVVSIGGGGDLEIEGGGWESECGGDDEDGGGDLEIWGGDVEEDGDGGDGGGVVGVGGDGDLEIGGDGGVVSIGGGGGL